VLKGDLRDDNKQKENQNKRETRKFIISRKNRIGKGKGRKNKQNSFECRCVVMTQDDDE
jgi:hypothetical protein